MRIVVTGAGGQLGSEIKKVTGGQCVFRSSSELDVTDPEAVRSLVETEAPEVIINAAAYTKVDLAEEERERAFAVNGKGAAVMAEAAAEAGALLVHISTDFVFDGLKSSPYLEDDETAPINVYGASKLRGEEETASSSAEHMIVRTSWLYGEGGKNFVKTILALARERESLRVVCDQVGSPTWTGDLAALIVGVAKGFRKGEFPSGIYHYSNEGVASWYDLATAVVEEARLLGVELACRTIEAVPATEYPTAAKRPAYSVLSNEKIKKVFSASIPHWRLSLRKMLTNYCGGSDA